MFLFTCYFFYFSYVRRVVLYLIPTYRSFHWNQNMRKVKKTYALNPNKFPWLHLRGVLIRADGLSKNFWEHSNLARFWWKNGRSVNHCLQMNFCVRPFETLKDPNENGMKRPMTKIKGLLQKTMHLSPTPRELCRDMSSNKVY